MAEDNSGRSHLAVNYIDSDLDENTTKGIAGGSGNAGGGHSSGFGGSSSSKAYGFGPAGGFSSLTGGPAQWGGVFNSGANGQPNMADRGPGTIGTIEQSNVRFLFLILYYPYIGLEIFRA